MRESARAHARAREELLGVVGVGSEGVQKGVQNFSLVCRIFRKDSDTFLKSLCGAPGGLNQNSPIRGVESG